MSFSLTPRVMLHVLIAPSEEYCPGCLLLPNDKERSWVSGSGSCQPYLAKDPSFRTLLALNDSCFAGALWNLALTFLP